MRFIIIVLLLSIMGCTEKKDSEIQKIDKTELKSLAVGNRVQLLDVRTSAEYAAGHIEGSKNFDVKDSSAFMRQIKTLDKHQPVYVYCKMGGRSAKAAKILKQQGFSTIFDYSGGYTDWITND